MMDDHWTDQHIHVVDGGYAAFDEAGLEYGIYDTPDEARDALVIYAAVYLSDAGERHRKQIEAELLDQLSNWFTYEYEGGYGLSEVTEVLDGKYDSLQQQIRELNNGT